MKYIEINFNRVVELFQKGESSRIFILCNNGDLVRFDPNFYSLNTLLNINQYFEQIEED